MITYDTINPMSIAVYFLEGTTSIHYKGSGFSSYYGIPYEDIGKVIQGLPNPLPDGVFEPIDGGWKPTQQALLNYAAEVQSIRTDEDIIDWANVAKDLALTISKTTLLANGVDSVTIDPDTPEQVRYFIFSDDLLQMTDVLTAEEFLTFTTEIEGTYTIRFVASDLTYNETVLEAS